MELAEWIKERAIAPRPDCTIWIGATDHGYGRIAESGRTRRVHQVVWEAANGPVPEGLEINHLCRIRTCCTLTHMELVTHSENVRRARPYRRSNTWDRAEAGKCPKGHDLEGNLYMRQNGHGRRCRACERDRDRDRRAKRKD